MAWATVEQLADLIGRDADDRMSSDLAVALDWAARRRSDIPLDAIDPDSEPDEGDVVCPATVHRAVLLYAAHLWWARANPTGTPATYTELDDGVTDSADMLEQAYRLLGKPKARAR